MEIRKSFLLMNLNSQASAVAEQAILLTVPMIGADGTVYGLCGFSVNQTYFLAHHAQPTGIGSLACVLSDSAEGLDVQKGLLTSVLCRMSCWKKGACAVG